MTSNRRSGPPSHDDHAADTGQRPSSQGGRRDFDAQWWEHHYQNTAAGPAGRPSAQLIAEVVGLTPGTVLEAGCGTGADAVWLARQGWEVTAVDASPSAVRHARTLAAQHEPDVTTRISWLVADLTGWQPPQQYDLVVSQYVHPDVPFGDFVARGAVVRVIVLLEAGTGLPLVLSAHCSLPVGSTWSSHPNILLNQCFSASGSSLRASYRSRWQPLLSGARPTVTCPCR
jgi:SAM-dependent methyltransferase